MAVKIQYNYTEYKNSKEATEISRRRAEMGTRLGHLFLLMVVFIALYAVGYTISYIRNGNYLYAILMIAGMVIAWFLGKKLVFWVGEKYYDKTQKLIREALEKDLQKNESNK